MNNENIKHLFTPASEPLPAGGAYFQFIWSDAYQLDVLDFGYYDQVRKCWFSLLTDNRQHNVTHWLDLSKLINKEGAKERIQSFINLIPDVEPEELALYQRGLQDGYVNSLKSLE